MTSRVPTLGQLRRSSCWVWIHCKACPHHAPAAFAPLIIRWGPDASSDRLRRLARCTACGARGATLQHPSHVDRVVGHQPFPAESLAPENAAHVRWS